MLSLSALFSEVPSPFSFTLSKRASLFILHVIGFVLAGVVVYDVYADWMLEGKPLWSTLLENALPLILALGLPVGGWRLSRAEQAKAYLSSAAKWAVAGCVGTLIVAGLTLGFQIVQREIKPFVFITQIMTAGALAGLLVGCILVEVHRRHEQERPERPGAMSDGVGPMPGGGLRLSKRMALGVLLVLGGILAGVVLYDIYADWIPEGKPLWSTLAENAIPLLLALLVPLSGWQMARSTDDELYLSAAAKWTFAGTAGMLVIAGSVVGLQIVQGELKPGIILTQMTTFGAVAGLFVGYSIARAQRVQGVLVDEKARLRTLAHSVPGGLYQFEVLPDRDTPAERYRFTFVGKHTEDLLGIEAHPQNYLERFVERVPDAHSEDLLASLDAAVDAEEQWTFELPFDRPDGERVWIRGIFSLERTSMPTGEERLVYHGVTIDVTDRKEAERRYEAIFNHTFQFTGLMTPDGTLIEANDTALEVGGLTEEDVLGTPVWETYWFQTGDEARERLREAVRRAAEGEFVRYEETIRSEQGPRVIDLSIRPLTDENGAVRMLVPEGRDITERKRKEQELERSRERWQRLVESLEVGLHVSVDGEIQYINPAGAEILGADDPDEIIGASLHTFVPSTEDRQETLQERLAALQRGESTEPHRWELSPLDGERRVIESYSVPIEFDGVQAAQSIMRDVTEREQRKRRLERKNDLFQKAQDLADVGAWEYDVVRDELTWTSQLYEIHGLSEDAFEPTPEKAFSFYHPEDRATIQEGFERAIEAGEDYDVEVRIETTAGETRWVRARGQAQTNGDGEVVRVRGTFQDVTDRHRREDRLREAKEEAEEASRLKSAMLANMSHEVRTPLTGINGFAEMLKDELEAQKRVFAEKIHESGQRLLSTLDSVIDLSRLEAGEKNLGEGSVRLGAVVEEAAALLRPEADGKSIDLAVHVPSEPVFVQASEGTVNRITENLVENAIKFTPNGGTVRVQVREANGYGLLEVEDTGVGIGEEAQARVFEAFEQESEGLDREYEGSGLGLSVVQELVDRLDGSVEVASEKGTGSRFTVRLPTPSE